MDVHHFEQVRTAATTFGPVPHKPYDTGMSSILADLNRLHEFLVGGLPTVGGDLPEIARVCRAGGPPVGEVLDPQSAQSIGAAVSRLRCDEDARNP